MYRNTDLEKLIKNLPIFVQKQLNEHSKKTQLIEIVLDLGRRPEARFITGPEYLSQKTISWQDLDYVTKRISKFSNKNRAGVERTLHRVSCIRNRQLLINGLTCRIGRAILGSLSLIRDLLELKKSILILGRPGVGKTTIVREIARVLADELQKRVIIIDTANEIAGDGDIPHFGIGRARRMQIIKTELQHQVMMEAVENHMPEVIVVDEIGTELEVLAVRTIAEKGVQLVGTTHGNCLNNLIKNPLLVDLIGGLQYVTLSDDEAKRRGSQKSILERKAFSTFDIIIEINNQEKWIIHENVNRSIDLFLRSNYDVSQIRKFESNKKIDIKAFKLNNDQNFSFINRSSLKNLSIFTYKNWIKFNDSINSNLSLSQYKFLVIYSCSISINILRESLVKIGLDFTLTNKIKKANVIISVKDYLRQNYALVNLAKQKRIPIYTVNQVNIYQLQKLFKT